MFGVVAKRSQRDNTVNGSLPSDQSTEEEDEFNMDEETYERRARLCSGEFNVNIVCVCVCVCSMFVVFTHDELTMLA